MLAMIDLDIIKKKLKDDFGINSTEEFMKAYEEWQGLDISIFTMPYKEVSYDKVS